MDLNPYQSPRGESSPLPQSDDIAATRLAVLTVFCLTAVLMFVPIVILIVTQAAES